MIEGGWHYQLIPTGQSPKNSSRVPLSKWNTVLDTIFTLAECLMFFFCVWGFFSRGFFFWIWGFLSDCMLSSSKLHSWCRFRLLCESSQSFVYTRRLRSAILVGIPHGDFHKWWYPQMDGLEGKIMENPIKIDNFEIPPLLGNLHIFRSERFRLSTMNWGHSWTTEFMAGLAGQWGEGLLAISGCQDVVVDFNG